MEQVNLNKLNMEVIALKQEMERMKNMIEFKRDNLNEELKMWELASLEDSDDFEKRI